MQHIHKRGIHSIKSYHSAQYIMTADILICAAEKEIKKVSEEMPGLLNCLKGNPRDTKVIFKQSTKKVK